MVTNEAPEKIYITPNIDRKWQTEAIDDESIEYTRTDAFIEKACEYINKLIDIPHNIDCADNGEPLADSYIDYAKERLEVANKIIEDFKEYMKGIKSKHAEGKLKEYIESITEESRAKARKQLEEESASNTSFIEIPFGTDSELIEESFYIPDGCYAIIESNKVVIRKGKEPVSEDLEEAADCYKDTVTPEEVDDSEHAYHYETYTEYQIADAFKAGANWQKEQIINNSIEAEVCDGYKYLPHAALIINKDNIKSLKTGDKIKIIILKE